MANKTERERERERERVCCGLLLLLVRKLLYRNLITIIIKLQINRVNVTINAIND